MAAQNKVEEVISQPADGSMFDILIDLVNDVTANGLKFDHNTLDRLPKDASSSSTDGPSLFFQELWKHGRNSDKLHLRGALSVMMGSDERKVMMKEAAKKLGMLISLFKVAPFAKEILRALFHYDNPQLKKSRSNKDDIFEAMRPYFRDMELYDNLNEALKGSHMSQVDIIKLYEFTTHHILPTSGAEKYGFVYWVETGRSETLNKSSDAAGEGKGKSEAKKEADTVCSWMKDRGYQSREECDWEGHQLEEKMAEHLGEIKEDCSVVVVFVMAHGSEGAVYGADNKPVSLKAIEKIILTEIPAEIPKVLVVQACQRSVETAGADGKLLAGELENAELNEYGIAEPNEYGIKVKTDPEKNLTKIHATIQEPNCNADGPLRNPATKIAHSDGQSSSRVSKPTDTPADAAFARVRSATDGQIAWRNTFIPELINQLKANEEFEAAARTAADKLNSKWRQKGSMKRINSDLQSTLHKGLNL